MKKTILLLISVFTFYVLIGNSTSSVVIPKNSIRLRVLANSNSQGDQQAKKDVKNALQDEVIKLLQNVNSIQESRQKIKDNIPYINNKIYKALSKGGHSTEFEINFGLNYFPDKTYKGVIYDEGYYESLLVTLGSGRGDNWWCVLFPPMCLLEAEETENVQYTTVVKEILNKYV